MPNAKLLWLKYREVDEGCMILNDADVGGDILWAIDAMRIRVRIWRSQRAKLTGHICKVSYSARNAGK